MQFGPRPLWMRDALCHEHPEISWFPVNGPLVDYDGPKSMCSQCLVRLDCLAYALENRIDYGIWGGMTAVDRRCLLAERDGRPVKRRARAQDGRPVRRRARRAQPVSEVALAAELITTTPIASSMTDVRRGPDTSVPQFSTCSSSVTRPCGALLTVAREPSDDPFCAPGEHPAARKPRRSRTNTMQPADEDDALLLPSEVAAMFHVDAKTVTRWARAGKLSSIRTLGGHRRFRESEIRAYLTRPDENDGTP
jgi:excisionase family DNA binding protein